MIRIGICDDDLKIRKQLIQIINEYEKSSNKVATYSSGEELLKEKKNFDVLFIDIDMKGIDGIATAKKIRSYDKGVKIIYVTSSTDYVNLAFQVHAFGYLNRPIKKEDIFKQLDEVLDYSVEEDTEEAIEFLTTDGVIRFKSKEIYFFEYVDRKVKLSTVDGNYFIKEKITTIGKNIEHYGFVVPHKSFIVNLFHVKAVKGYNITMMNGDLVPLSQKKSSEFREALNIYLEKRI